MSMNPRVRILSTGSEITTGLYADTNAQRLSRTLLEEGFQVISHAAVPDDRKLLAEEIRSSLHGCELVVSTGGLGPTEDDLNREVVAEIFNVPLIENARALDMMEHRFVRRGIPMPQRNRVQALIPEGAIMLENHWGTAPGFLFPPKNGLPAFVALPGPSSEWVPMFTAVLRDYLDGIFASRPASVLHCLHLAMTPESVLNEVLSDLFHRENIDLTILAGRGIIRLRILSRDRDRQAAEQRVAEVHGEVLRRIGAELPFDDGRAEVTLQKVLVELMGARGLTLALAESCTGGLVSQRITDVPGSSAVFLAGFVTYSNEAKQRDLAVPEGLLAEKGAVSREVARAMAEGALRRCGATIAASVTGIAGPDGGTPEKPVGLVHFAVAGVGETLSIVRQFSGDRSLIREWAANQCMELIRRAILGIDPEVYLGGSNPRRLEI